MICLKEPSSRVRLKILQAQNQTLESLRTVLNLLDIYLHSFP